MKVIYNVEKDVTKECQERWLKADLSGCLEEGFCPYFDECTKIASNGKIYTLIIDHDNPEVVE